MWPTFWGTVSHGPKDHGTIPKPGVSESGWIHVDQGANLARIRQQAGNLAARALTQKLLNVGGVGGLEGGMWRAMETLGETPQIPRAAYNQGIGRDVPRSQRGPPMGNP